MENEEFLVEGEFIFHSYIPDKLTTGMKFLTKRVISSESELFLFTLDIKPENDEEFMAINGAPVTINIITSGTEGEILALPEEIGLFAEEKKPLRDITDHEINTIINQYGGIMNIESDETGDPILYDGKVIISYLSELDGEEEES